MAALLFYFDYASELVKANPRAFALYMLYDKFQDSEGHVPLSFPEMREILKFNPVQLKEALEALVERGLVVEIEKGKYKVEKLGPIGFDSELKDRYNFSLGLGLDSLLNIDKMKKAFNELGDTKFNIAQCLVKHFGLDKNKFTLAMETESFSAKIREVRSAVKSQVTIGAGSPIVSKSVAKSVTKTNPLYEQFLQEGNLKRGTKTELPLNEWKSPQLLWYFCILYKKKYGQDFLFVGNLYKSKEMKHMSQILETFGSAVEVKSYFDWVFNVKEKDLNGIDSTGIVASVRMMNEFRKTKTNAVRKTNSSVSFIPPDFLDWIKANAISFLEVSNCKTIEDLKWAKRAVMQDEADDITKLVVTEATGRGLL